MPNSVRAHVMVLPPGEDEMEKPYGLSGIPQVMFR